MDRDQFTIVRDGQMYHTDRETVAVLNAVQQWDQSDGTRWNTAAQDIFARGLQHGRISEGPAYGNAVGQCDHYANDDISHTQRSASGYPAPQEHYDPTYVDRVIRHRS
jgi:hypothetical protein